MILGVIPDSPIEKVRAAGNAAGSGAVRMLLSREQRLEVEELVRTVEKIETATEPRFQELFVNAMAFPHASSPTPHLKKLVDFSNVSKGEDGLRRRDRKQRARDNKED